MRVLLFAVIQVSLLAQTFPFPGPGGNNSGPPPSYSGPGDIASGALAWWGLRAYSLAKAGTKAANICNASDANCADVNTLANGNLDVSTAQGSPLNCGGAGGTCTVKTLYDQSGNTSCVAGAVCNITQATIALRPTLTFSCVGSLPCLTWTATQLLTLNPPLTSTHSQPYSISAVGERTGGFTSYSDLAGANSPQIGFSNSANLALLYAGSLPTKAATDNTFHALNGLLNGASSILSVDGSASTVNAGTNALQTSGGMGAQNNGLIGKSMEAGYWGSDISAVFSALSSNQHSYWGF